MHWQCLYQGVVEAGWLDEYDHVNFLEYQRVADLASTSFWNMAMQTAQTKGDFVIVETYVRYLNELRLGDAVTIHSAIAGFDAKRIHFIHQIQSGDKVACVIELIVLSFDLATRRSARFPESLSDWLRAFQQAPDESQPQSPPLPTLSLPGGRCG
jgi:acyl-CoA thioesterase FadM